MRVVTSMPHQVRVLENTFIPMGDGARLAARVWLPVDAEERAVPALLEYLPYRKRDITRSRDQLNHHYLAGHGYASVRVDMRGSGDSDGVLVDEYRPQEQVDACEVIAWLAEQPWCDGNVGMFGISWGGFNSLQVAARRPPALKAIISASASDDLYLDNMHYMGGCLLADNLSEATVMFAFNSLPPDPAIVGERWREMWQERLEGSGLWLETWLEHQRRDDYYLPGSVSEAYDDIACPVYAVGGWADGYTNAIFRLMEHLQVPRKALIGPWGHRYPHQGRPGPAIGFLQESVRWWDHWLKGVETGVMDEPMLRVWMQDSIRPRASYELRPGRWVAEPCWPSPGVVERRLRLQPHRLVDDDVREPEDVGLLIDSPLSVGMFGGKWASYSVPPDLPHDQREEDGGALVFETAALSEDLEILGRPILDLDVAADAPVAMIAARLSDVAPDGAATRVTYGLLNLTHRDSSRDPEPLEQGRRYRVEVPLNGVAQVFPAGHRIRLSLSTTYWPVAWPPPQRAAVTVWTAGSSLRLPVRTPRPGEDAMLPVFEEPEAARPLATTVLEPGDEQWRVIRDLVADTSTVQVLNDQGAVRIDETGTIVRHATGESYSSRGNDVGSVRGETETERRLQRDDWYVRVVTRTVLTSTSTEFVVEARLDAYEGDPGETEQHVHGQDWHRRIARDLL